MLTVLVDLSTISIIIGIGKVFKTKHAIVFNGSNILLIVVFFIMSSSRMTSHVTMTPTTTLPTTPDSLTSQVARSAL